VTGLLAVVFVMVGQTPSWAAPLPVVNLPGYTVSVYAHMEEPANLWARVSGQVFVGHQLLEWQPNNNQNVNRDILPVRRISADQSSIENPAGNVRFNDPDVVAVDELGMLTGEVGSIVVGRAVNGSSGKLSVIRPDGTVVESFVATTSQFVNPSQAVFDSSGALLFTDGSGRRLVRVRNIAGSIVVDTLRTFSSDVFGLARDPATGDLYVAQNSGALNGTIVRLNASGVVLNPSFGVADVGGPMTWGAAIGFGPGLFCHSASVGKLYYFNPLGGDPTLIGTGFSDATVPGVVADYGGLAILPNGSLLVSDTINGRVVRIAKGDCEIADLNGDGVVNTADLTKFLGRFGRNCQ
jgi:hypothetical protein